jgi:hypothetical protein
MNTRYIITPPKNNGGWWWYVVDTEDELMPNFYVASFSASLGQSEMWARLLCDQLNRGEK